MEALQTYSKFGRARLAGTSVLAIAAVLGGSPALADCSPGATGGNDVIICDDSSAPGGVDVSSGGGDDTITINSGNYGTVRGNYGTDAITLNGGSVVSIQGDGFDIDFEVLQESPVGGDIINLFGGTVSGDVTGPQLGDTITLDGAASWATSLAGSARWAPLYTVPSMAIRAQTHPP